ncbi:MAG: HU family DNA-binding protein [Ignavibacteria bacterium]|nr:HU family DNA-binding protein [Ignavibacteria bacterium]
MNNKSLLNRVKRKTLYDEAVCSDVYEFIFEIFKNELKANKYINIDDIGEFRVKFNELEVEYNVSKKKNIIRPPKEKIIFKCSEELIKKINFPGE